MNKEQFEKMRLDTINGCPLECSYCKGKDLTIDINSFGTATMDCNSCHTIQDVTKVTIPTVDSFKPKGVMQATICYDSIESAIGPMTLGMLHNAVTEALEKGMPLDSEVFESNTEAPISSVRFLYETDRVSPIECGGHIYPDKGFDILVDTHECPENH